MADNEQFADYLGQLQEAQFPRWTDLPQFDLYMDQVIQYVNDIVTPLGFGEITSTMVNNYVKKGVIKAPLKKKYRPEQLANI
ncbi:BS_ykrK family protein [Lacticaseibacillus paracasei]|nr:BS_ykrK family protein [Lacticaseibacillus paracasei]